MKEMLKSGWVYFLITFIVMGFMVFSLFYHINVWIKFIVSSAAFYAMLYKAIIDIKK